MTSRERVLRTINFRETDRAPYDLMESIVWPELQQWFAASMGLSDADAVRDYLHLDFRWCWPEPKPPSHINLLDGKYAMPYSGNYSDHALVRPLANVSTIEELLKKHAWPDPQWWDFTIAQNMRAKHPDKAIVLLVHYTMMLMNAFDFFGMEEAMMRLAVEDEVLLEFLRRQNKFSLAMIRHACEQAKGAGDICWLMDDVSTQRAMMMNPDLWRKHLKEPLRQQIALIHEYGLRSMYHCCGTVRDILPDLIEIGLDVFEPFQTTATGMDAASIARDFGGRIAFYGGMDVQHLLPFGTEEEVREQVRCNLKCFAQTGGYMVSNSHHCIPNIKPQNICAMFAEARQPHAMGTVGSHARLHTRDESDPL